MRKNDRHKEKPALITYPGLKQAHGPYTAKFAVKTLIPLTIIDTPRPRKKKNLLKKIIHN